MSPEAAITTNPFPGLRPFREEEEYLFFGRASQVHAMVDKLAAKRFLAVVGPSGSGKSSLVNCGLRPALHRGLMPQAGTAWRMVQFRPGNRPLGASALEDQVCARPMRESKNLRHGVVLLGVDDHVGAEFLGQRQSMLIA